MRLTDAPTVPYPSSPTPTSMDAKALRSEEAFHARKRAQLLPHPLDLRRVLLAARAQLREPRPAGFVVREELIRKRAASDLFQNPPHPLANSLVDDARPARQVAVLGDVRH